MTIRNCPQCEGRCIVKENKDMEPCDQSPFVTKFVVCVDCGYTDTEDSFLRHFLEGVCAWLVYAMERDSKIWLAIRKHEGSSEWMKKFEALVEQKG